jgi:hypothetical protein
MGFDVVSFHNILNHRFEHLWNETPILRHDVATSAAPRAFRHSLDACGTLGLVLHYLNSTMLEVSLSQIFTLVPTTVSWYIMFALGILLFTLRHMKDAQIQWPVGEEFQKQNDLILARHPLLIGAFGIMDGLNLLVQTSHDDELESATFNGWLHEHFVSSVFAFGADGKHPQTSHCLEMTFSPLGVIIACKLNAPGSWHDLHVAHPIYEKLHTNSRWILSCDGHSIPTWHKSNSRSN